MFSIILLLIILSVGIFIGSRYNDNPVVETFTDKSDDLISYGKNVKVSKSIAEGYENSNYIPRSVSLNKKLKQDG